MEKIRIGSRKSKLALAQSKLVKDLLAEHHIACELITMSTEGDQQPDKPILDMGGSTVFVKAIERALQKNEIDLAVHSLKDMSIDLPEDLCRPTFIGQCSRHDVLITKNGDDLSELPAGATIGTGSLRRKYQLLINRPDLKIVPIRGNVDTRLKKLFADQVDGLILAAAGLERLNYAHDRIRPCAIDQMVPAGGQGIIAIESRLADSRRWPALIQINDELAAQMATIEFEFLKTIGATCHTPVGVCMQDQQHRWKGTVFIANQSGDQWIRFEANFNKTENCIGLALAQQAKAQWQQTHGEESW